MRPRTEQPTNPGGRPIRWAGSAGTALLSTAALVSGGMFAAAPAFAAPSAHPSVHVKHLCAQPTKPGEVACNAEARTDIVRHMSVGPNNVPTGVGYGPADLQSAYNLPTSVPAAGTTVAIVDAYDNPNAEADLAVYRSQYGLPACTTSNGCFHKVDQTGGTNYPASGVASGWASEISLDLDMVSAACPECHILLVEANSSNFPDLGPAVNEAVALGAKYVSGSWGAPTEDPSETSLDTAYFNHPGVAMTFSAGDQGYGVQYPAASPYVTSVGGTSLSRANNSRGWTESVWNNGDGTGATGSGCSAYESKPSWQTDTGCANRTVADVSADADPYTGVAVYDSYGYNQGWNEYGGTSAAAPFIAATYALAGAPAASSYPSSYPYGHTASLNDVTSGSDLLSSSSTCSPSYLCTAGPGYDGPTGLGTPNGTAAFSSSTPSTLLQGGQKLTSGQSISSAGMTLSMQSDGNLVAYLKTGPTGTGPAVWSSGTYGHSGAYATMQTDGNLVVYSSAGTALWSTGTWGHSGAHATLQDDGNLVVYSSTGSALWSTGTYKRSTTIGSGQKLTPGWWTQAQYTRLVMQSDGNLVLYRNSDGKALWSSGTWNHYGAYAVMQTDGNLVVYKSGTALWATGTWGNSGAYARVQDDGNFVVYRSSGGALWASNTWQQVP